MAGALNVSFLPFYPESCHFGNGPILAIKAVSAFADAGHLQTFRKPTRWQISLTYLVPPSVISLLARQRLASAHVEYRPLTGQSIRKPRMVNFAGPVV